MSNDTQGPFSLESIIPSNLDDMDPRVVNELQYIIQDIIGGDPRALERPEFRGLDIGQIKAALNFILEDATLSEGQKADLLTNSWRVNYRDRPPTPTEFLTEKYLGPVANTIYPQVKKAFLEYLDPTKPYRTVVLYPHIGWGKSYLAVLVNIFIGMNLSMMRAPWKFFGQSQPLDCKVLTPTGFKAMGDIEVGDEVTTPGGVTEVIEIHPQGTIPTYEIELEDGRKTRCSAQHLWKVSSKKDITGEKLWEIVDTQFMIDHPELEFELPEAPQCIVNYSEAEDFGAS
jgi:hypothetical protein